MSILNCPNCGAPIDFELTKCPYCRTFYINTYQKIDNNKKFILINQAITDAIVTHNYEKYERLSRVKRWVMNELKLS